MTTEAQICRTCRWYVELSPPGSDMFPDTGRCAELWVRKQWFIDHMVDGSKLACRNLGSHWQSKADRELT